jgi:aminoglycoside/choline kinase family phosphotransferase
MKSQLLSLYERHFGHRPEAIVDLRADGSNRSLYRLIDADGKSVVGVHGPDHEENRAFLSYSRTFRSLGLPVPEIHIADEEAGLYLEEDLGDITLFNALTTARTSREVPPEIVAAYRRVVDLLPRVQVEGGRAIDFSVAYPCAEFDRRSMSWDLNYFKYHFLKLAHIPFNEARLEEDFSRLCDFLLEADRSSFLFRDFQSRNIMLRHGEPWLIDYQGGRRGALQYDIASLLYDAKADLPEELRAELLDAYLDALERYIPVDRGRFAELYRGFVLIRIMQAMGAYGYRGFFERKAHFLASVPYAIANIEILLERGLPVEMPELRRVFERISSSGLRGAQAAASGGTPIPASDDVPVLTVHLRSFSYRRGYPEDVGGQGGGFVFDCRSLHNPGRYEEYKALCGRDAEVIDFLEREEKVGEFWAGIRALVDGAVENYLERGFEHLSVAFGCTGGQHRSVYFTERLARHLRERFPTVAVELEHREEDRWPARPAISAGLA